jgi:hypothetical protein
VGRGVPTAVMKRVIRENFGPASKTHPLLRFLEPERVPAAEDTLVFLNGTFFAVTREPEALESVILSMRRSQNLAFETRVAWDRRTFMRRYFFVNTDCSAVIRPVYVVENLHRLSDIVKTTGASPMLWRRLVQAGIIEYIDKEEEDARHLLIATFAKDFRRGNMAKPYTHVEIDPTNEILIGEGSLVSTEDAKPVETCPICYETDSVIRQTLSCGHTFHLHCVEQWLRKNSTCPMCRCKISVYM